MTNFFLLNMLNRMLYFLKPLYGICEGDLNTDNYEAAG